jgi:hypothetical protein
MHGVVVMDGLEEDYTNPNQGADSRVSYLMAD